MKERACATCKFDMHRRVSKTDLFDRSAMAACAIRQTEEHIGHSGCLRCACTWVSNRKKKVHRMDHIGMRPFFFPSSFIFIPKSTSSNNLTALRLNAPIAAGMCAVCLPITYLNRNIGCLFEWDCVTIGLVACVLDDSRNGYRRGGVVASVVSRFFIVLLIASNENRKCLIRI